ncbi:hypothetical protein AZA_88261 [Nitrospirillum viridazoti Y2]|nr:hypothetical protein AZA_88261 [Nitrospirillum amazonense Y2]
MGTDCCDRLTGATDARDHHDGLIKEREKRKRFVDSPKWKVTASGDMVMVRDRIPVRITFRDGSYGLEIGSIKGRLKYPTALDAKIRAFEFIESGEAARFFADRRARLDGLIASSVSNDRTLRATLPGPA